MWLFLALLLLFLFPGFFQRLFPRRPETQTVPIVMARTSMRARTTRPVPVPRPDSPPILLENIDPQIQSPLFNRIPGEIRDRVLEFALAEHDDRDKPYRRNNWFYRPGFHYHRKMDTAILRTCRRIYAEAKHLPLQQAELVFWAYRGPTAYREPSHDVHHVGKKMTPSQQDSIQSIHFFTQQYFLEGNMAPILSWSGLSTKKFKITIRHQDWWNWENDAPIAINPFKPGRAMPNQMDVTQYHPGAWGNHVKNIKGLEQFEMEFETVAHKKDQLDAIVAWARNWELKLAGGRNLRNTSVKTWNWEGLVKLTHEVDSPAEEEITEAGHEVRREPAKQVYYVVNMVWMPENMVTEA